LAIGAYRAGGDALLDAALSARPALDALIFDGDGSRNAPDVAACLHEAVAGLQSIAA
jgi:flagellar biosynthesis/type III secretory pathway ATPase